MSLDDRLQRIWYGPAWRGWPLWPLSLVYRVVVALRAAMYRGGLLRAAEVGVPVVVVGNVTVGGTGKTPVASWLARQLAARGLRVGVVLRGYGGTHRGAPRIVQLSDNPAEVGDEALLHRRREIHVVVVGADRAEAARLAVRQGAEVVLGDDGLQHLHLPREYEIAVVDGVRRLGNGRLLPAGPLREPASRLERVHAVIVTQREPCDAADPVRGQSMGPEKLRKASLPGLHGPLQLAARLRLGDAVNLATGERRPLAAFAGSKSLHAVAGVGHPDAFFAALRAAGLEVTPHALPDHARLDPEALALPSAATVLMTEKDAVKCAIAARREWWWVELEVHLGRSDAQLLMASILERTGLGGAGVNLG